MTLAIRATIAAGGLFAARVTSTFRLRENIKPLTVQFSSFTKQFSSSVSRGDDIGIKRPWRNATYRMPETVREEPNRLLIIGE